MSARIPPLLEEEWDDEVRSALGRLDWDPLPNVFTTMARHPRLLRRWLGLGDHLLFRSTLPAREREIVILRTAVLAGSEYEWAQHSVIGRREGLTDDELARIRSGPEDPGWSEEDRVTLQAVDELHRMDDLPEPTWRQLAERWGTEQLMDLVMTVGFYTMTAMALNAFGVEPE